MELQGKINIRACLCAYLLIIIEIMGLQRLLTPFVVTTAVLLTTLAATQGIVSGSPLQGNVSASKMFQNIVIIVLVEQKQENTNIITRCYNDIHSKQGAKVLYLCFQQQIQ